MRKCCARSYASSCVCTLPHSHAHVSCGWLPCSLQVREMYADKRFKPLDIRVKKTRAIRRRLTDSQAAKKTKKQLKRDLNFPVRKFAVRA